MSNIFNMKRKQKGGVETIIAIVIITAIVAALLFLVVMPMTGEGDRLIGETTNQLVNQQTLIGPS